MDRSVFKILISNSGAFPFRFHLSHRNPPVRWRGKLKNPAPALTLKPERSGPLPTLVFRPGKDQGKPDALSRRPDYSPHKGGDSESKYKVFLKPSQVDARHLTSSVKVNAAAAQAIDTDEDLAQAIKASLKNDPTMAQCLENLENPELPR